jgi:mannan endo-1,4-beta-mannosidase
MIWNVMGHDAQCCNYVQHNDGYSLLYPDGNSAADQANILQVVKHWYKVTGRSQPSKLPAVACPQPVFCGEQRGRREDEVDRSEGS